MSQGIPAYTFVGNGTRQQTSVGSALLLAVPSASTLPGDLVVMVAYSHDAVEMGEAIDAGDGWVMLASGFPDPHSILLAALIATFAGATGYSGITLPATATWTAQTATYRIAPPGRFSFAGFSRGEGYLYQDDPGNITTIFAPAINQGYGEVIDLVARGYTHGGTPTTVAAMTLFTERFDTSPTSPPHGVVLNDRTAAIRGATQNILVSSAPAVAVDLCVGVRAMIPLVGNVTPMRGRLTGNRRYG